MGAAVKLEAINHRLRMLPSNAVIYINARLFPKVHTVIAKGVPDTKIVFRAHNAEALHNLTNFVFREISNG